MSILASSLALGAADYSWRDHALCRDTDPELFFPVGTTGTALVQIERAKQVCGECAVRVDCLDFALTHEPGLRRLGRAVRGGAAGHPPPARRPGPLPRRRLTSAPARSACSARSTSTDRARSSSGRTRAHGDVDAAVLASGRAARSPTNTTSVSCSVPARLRSASAAAALDIGVGAVGQRAAAPSTATASWLRLRTTTSWAFGTWSVLRSSRSRVVTRPMLSTTAWIGSRPPHLDDELVADAVAVLEQHRQAGEVVVDLVLAADRHAGADEPGARQEEGGVDVEQVEHGDRRRRSTRRRRRRG